MGGDRSFAAHSPKDRCADKVSFRCDCANGRLFWVMYAGKGAKGIQPYFSTIRAHICPDPIGQYRPTSLD